MNLFEMIIIHMIFIFFPILLYLIYVAYYQSVEKKENEVVFQFALLSSLYLAFKFEETTSFTESLLLMNIPLMIAYMKKREASIFLVSCCLVWYYSAMFSYPLVALVIEYGLYYVIYMFLFKKRMDDCYFLLIFVMVKLIMFTLCLWQVEYFVGITQMEMVGYLLICSSFVVLTFLGIYLLKKAEDILRLHMTVKEVQKEKQVLHSLFQITHEIKNPIAVCKGYLDMFDVNNREHSRQYIPIIKEEIERTLLLLQDFLSIRKIKIENDILDIQYLVEDTVLSLQPLLKEKKVILETRYLDDEIYMMGDYNRLKQVLVNLLKNGIEAMECSFQKRLVVETMVHDGVFQIMIEDSGEGIEADHLARMKEPFFTTKAKGTGLGVYLSNEIVHAHKGKLEYESVPGEGTQVRVFLRLLENEKGS